MIYILIEALEEIKAYSSDQTSRTLAKEALSEYRDELTTLDTKERLEAKIKRMKEGKLK